MTDFLTFDPAAERDLLEAVEFYDLERPSLGQLFLDRVEAALQQIVAYPQGAPAALGQPRKFVLDGFPYSIMYWLDESGVVVSAVAHQSRRLFYWQNRQR